MKTSQRDPSDSTPDPRLEHVSVDVEHGQLRIWSTTDEGRIVIAVLYPGTRRAHVSRWCPKELFLIVRTLVRVHLRERLARARRRTPGARKRPRPTLLPADGPDAS